MNFFSAATITLNYKPGFRASDHNNIMAWALLQDEFYRDFGTMVIIYMDLNEADRPKSSMVKLMQALDLQARILTIGEQPLPF